VDEQAVRPAIEHAVDPDGLGPAEGAAVVVPRGVEPRVQAGLDRPMGDIVGQPLPRRELFGGAAGDEFHRFRGAVFALPVHAGHLGRKGEARGLGADVARDQGARDQFAFFQTGPAHRRRIFQGIKKREPGSGTCACTVAWRPGWFALTVSR